MALLEMKHVWKQFGKVVANADVSLEVEKGEVHALLGENGAGKSTLMNILYGLYKPSLGEIYFNGEKLDIKSPQDAIERGIGMVHQHFMLIPALTVIENVILGLETNGVVLDRKKAAREFAEMAKGYDMEINPWAKVSSLSVGQQQRVEILKALYRKASLLILDEPTAVLTPQEVTALFKVIRQLKEQGMSIILIGHKMQEIMAVCDKCTILRLGHSVATLPISEIESEMQLAELMVGEHVQLNMEKTEANFGKEVLDVSHISYRDKKKVQKIHDISFKVREGEIVGIAGIDGNGQSELVKCIAGLLHPSEGQISLYGEDISHLSTRDIIKKGVSHIPEDRHNMGMVAEMSINENLMLMNYYDPQYSRHGLLNSKKIKSHNEDIVEMYNVKTPDVYEKAGNLSGGNQQKVVVGRELDRNPKFLIAMHPDRGLDIGASKFIQQKILDERAKGTAVLLVSTELDEVMELSDQIIVLNSGEVMGQIRSGEATVEEIGLMMAGVKK